MKLIADRVDFFSREEDILTAIQSLQKEPGVKVISFVNAHACNLASLETNFSYSLLQSDLLLRDGMGVKILLKLFSKEVGYNANGTDLIPKVLDMFDKKKIIFIGTQEPYLSRAKDVCINKGINIIATMDGFKTIQQMDDFITKHAPEILVLGMGMPKQELYSQHLKETYPNDLVIVNGGAIFDFLAGRFNRAPLAFRGFGLEWLYRLLNEPIRLFRRYVIGIPVFFIKILYAKYFNKL